MADRDDFLRAIKAEPQNYLSRCVFADWLDERGEHEEAERQRSYEAAWKWFEELAENDGYTWDGEGKITAETLVEAGNVFAANNTAFVQRGSSGLQDALYGERSRFTFWRNWSVVTGRPIPEWALDESPFRCSC